MEIERAWQLGIPRRIPRGLVAAARRTERIAVPLEHRSHRRRAPLARPRSPVLAAAAPRRGRGRALGRARELRSTRSVPITFDTIDTFERLAAVASARGDAAGADRGFEAVIAALEQAGATAVRIARAHRNFAAHSCAGNRHEAIVQLLKVATAVFDRELLPHDADRVDALKVEAPCSTPTAITSTPSRSRSGRSRSAACASSTIRSWPLPRGPPPRPRSGSAGTARRGADLSASSRCATGVRCAPSRRGGDAAQGGARGARRVTGTRGGDLARGSR